MPPRFWMTSRRPCVGLTDPTGTIDIGVGLKYDSDKGGGIGGDFKFGGPVKLKYSRDIYFTN